MATEAKRPNLKRTRECLEESEKSSKSPAEVTFEKYIYIMNNKPGRFCSPFNQPFNALYLHRVLCIKFLNGYENQEIIKLEFKLGKKKLKYYSKASSFGKDLCALSFYYCLYGTDIESILQVLEPNAKTVFEYLVERYSIQSTATNEETITLKRLGDVYPNAVCVAFNRKMAKRPIKMEQIFLNESFPPCFTCPNLINCVPERLLKSLLPFTFLCALEIEQTELQIVKKPKITDVWFEHIAAYKSGMLYCDTTRNEFMDQLEITDFLVERLQEYIPDVMKKIKEILGDSPLSGKIIQEIQLGDL